MANKNALDTLYERGFIKQTVYEEDLRKLLDTESISFYVGFDPTADSLHIGHYIPIMAMAHMQKAGHNPIALIGGGTGMIGDPSDRNDMRKLMTKEIVDANCAAFQKQMARFFRFDGKNAAKMVNNGDWLLNLNYVDFLRDVGMYFSVNKMLTADCYKTRLEKGLTFFEFNYMLMQAYDFYVLFKEHKCCLQMGGNDQWSNILAGADLIRRKEQQDAYAMTFTLLESSDGKKMGKTAKGALWLDAEKTSPYDFYQYFRNVEDVKVEECFKLLTFLELDEIHELCKHKDQRINEAKARLAYEVTKLVHGQDEAQKAQEQVKASFSGDISNMPELEVSLSGESTIIELLVTVGFAKNNSDARRLIEGKGVKLAEKTVADVKNTIKDFTTEKTFALQKGKKNHVKVVLK